MMRRLAIIAAMASTGCASTAGAYAVTSALYLFLPAGRASGGEGSISDVARTRLEAANKEARVTAVTDAITAAKAHPDDVRLLRRATAMARALGADGRCAY